MIPSLKFFILCFRLGLAASLLIVAFFGAGLHLSVRDTLPSLAIAYYVLPWPVVLGLLVPAVALLWPWRWLRAGTLALTAITVGIWLWNQPFWQPQGTPLPDDITLLFWTADGAERSVLDISEQGAADGIDIMAFAEAGVNPYTNLKPFQDAHPHYHSEYVPGSRYIVVRGMYQRFFYKYLGNRTTVIGFEAVVDDRVLRIVLADVGPDPFVSRDKPLAAILKLAQKHHADLVIGDFNTPYESAFFDPYREAYTHALHTGGAWLRETWPYPLPVLAIDHIWVSSAFEVVRTERFVTFASHHAGLIVRLRRKE